ncbi:HD domain-containing phosphohydrolase [Spirochaeta dissipatitropha]
MPKTTKYYRYFLILLLCTAYVVLPSHKVSAEDAVISRAIESAEAELITGDYERAFARARLILRYYSDQSMPQSALSVSQRTVRLYANDLASRQAWHALQDLEKELISAPAAVRSQATDAFQAARNALAEERILQAEMDRLAEIERQQETELRRQEEIERRLAREREEFEARQSELMAEREQLDAVQQGRIDRIIEMNQRLELEREQARQEELNRFMERQSELETARLEQEERFRNQLERTISTSLSSTEQALQATASLGYTVVIGLAAAGFIVLALAILFVVISVRQQKVQQEQFQNTIRTIQAMQISDGNHAALPFRPDAAAPSIGGPSAGLLADSRTGTNPLNNDEVRALTEQCRSYAQQIDSITRRKNASQAVAESVYKISIASGVDPDTAMLHYAAGLVYDIGFLNIDPELLAAGSITEEQFKIIKTHTTIGLNMVFFVPESSRSLFKDAVSKHHENLDGTGYPYGLKGDEIPYIARAIRVVESYIALVSSRNYRDILDREAAFEELYKSPQYYDIELIKMLDTVT